ncbi:DUF1629 domain-containing protein [Bradyrhizobium sp. CCGUVB1N3]|uniref:imm11 family protein n=1 Tax=Bradyrhizobium sp. CCGUVB1N3 TaxID=2949629 RepID=UPI0020B2D787|nr:DUF1629 domain-containing protein [Bradyrhizobium sp. CCGUVB1N3]MCP3476986.1 DUF1629 domain-containing protein [Bradyrhizobium sp. CCGUVB1N3]
MSDEKSKSIPRRSRARKRKFYVIGPDYRVGGKPGFRLEDNNILPRGHYHLPPFDEPPRFVFDKKAGDLPYDLESYYGFWLVSDRTKAVLETVDPKGLSFVLCDVRIPNGVCDGSRYWFCDVLRVLDALDEAKSRLKIGIRDDDRYRDFGKKFYDFSGGAELVFREDAVGDAHVFRMAHHGSTVICDGVLKDACKSAGLKRIWFEDVSKL